MDEMDMTDVMDTEHLGEVDGICESDNVDDTDVDFIEDQA